MTSRSALAAIAQAVKTSFAWVWAASLGVPVWK